MAKQCWPPEPGFHLVETTRIAGRFEGLAHRTVFRLDGARHCWLQWLDRTEPASIDSLLCHIYTDYITHFLGVDRLSGEVEIRACTDPNAESPDAHSAPLPG